jgi:hypothetical protein
VSNKLSTEDRKYAAISLQERLPAVTGTGNRITLSRQDAAPTKTMDKRLRNYEDQYLA